MTEYAPYIWLGLIVLFAVFEGATVSLNFIWFSLGGVAALIAAFAGADPIVQGILFIVLSAVSLIFAKPLLRKFIIHRKVATNADRLIGEKGVTMETVDNLAQTGLVKVAGQVWTARTVPGGSPVPSDAVVVIDAIEGVKLIVHEEAAQR